MGTEDDTSKQRNLCAEPRLAPTAAMSNRQEAADRDCMCLHALGLEGSACEQRPHAIESSA